MPWPKGKPLPDDHKDKISRTKRGVPQEPRHRENISKARKEQEERKKK